MLKTGIILVLVVYLIEGMVCFFAISLANKASKQIKLNPKSGIESTRRTVHVILIIGGIYFVPLEALAICLVFYPRMVSLIIILILSSTGIVTDKVIIPASRRRHIDIVDEMYGKDSKYSQYLRQRYNIDENEINVKK